MKKAIFPGSFDPFTVGHESIVNRALSMFDHIIIAVGYNSDKKSGFFPIEDRMTWISKTFENNARISVETFDGLTVDFCRKKQAGFILRGLRTASDFEYERAIAQTNKQMYPEIESVFILTTPEYTHVTSTIVRDIIRHNGNARQFLPSAFTIDPLMYNI